MWHVFSSIICIQNLQIGDRTSACQTASHGSKVPDRTLLGFTEAKQYTILTIQTHSGN